MEATDRADYYAGFATTLLETASIFDKAAKTALDTGWSNSVRRWRRAR